MYQSSLVKSGRPPIPDHFQCSRCNLFKISPAFAIWVKANRPDLMEGNEVSGAAACYCPGRLNG